MRILMVNKFLYPNGGSETYIFKLGDYLKKQNHEVEYFGMEHDERVVGNSSDSYTTNMNFHTSKIEKMLYPIKIIYSKEARKKIRIVLDNFKPDVVHLNNFNFQLTPAIIFEIRKYEKDSKKKVKIVFTAHDYQLICPNHMMNIPSSGENCEKCIKESFVNCIKNKCIHNSTIKSVIGSIESSLYHSLKVYKHIDIIICPSWFMAEKMNSNKLFKQKTVVLHNFIEAVKSKEVKKEDYILYFGRYSNEKGIKTLIDVCKKLPQIKFVFAGNGPLENAIENISNIKNVGFKSGNDLENLIRKAQFSIYPSEWYENCPFSVMESQMYGTPVLGANIGGVPELIHEYKTGELFKSGDCEALELKIKKLWENRELIDLYSKNCNKIEFDTIQKYYERIIKIYQE